MSFNPIHIEMFMGGDFRLGNHRTVGALRDALKAMDTELAEWGDDHELAEVVVVRNGIQVTLKDGIPR